MDGGALKASANLVGLLRSSPDDWFQGGEDAAAVEGRIAERTAAKKNRDFATADRIRDELKSEGIVLEDGPTRHYVAKGMTEPLYTTEILRLAASLSGPIRSIARTAARKSGHRPAGAASMS